jgi:hypothetical protein
LKIQKISQYVLKPSKLVVLVAILATFGTVQMLTAGVWDAASHALKEPESFWSIQHVAVYAGVGMVSLSAVLGGFLLKTTNTEGFLKLGIQIIIAGAILQLVAGYADSVSHEIFGIDGLISWSHQPLELGLVLSVLGSFLVLKSNTEKRLSKFLPFSIMTLILSVSWLGFNLLLLVGAQIMCIPVYEFFSSGCAIL